MIQELLHTTVGDSVIDVNRLESRASAPMINHTCILTASLSRDWREKGLAGGTSWTGISITTSDDENIP